MSRILIVEDENIIAMTTRLQLESLGHEVVGLADSSHKAIEIMENNELDLILMDIEIKGDMDGIELGRMASGKYGCSIVYISGSPKAISESVRQAGFLPKPFSEEQLRDVIEANLKQPSN